MCGDLLGRGSMFTGVLSVTTLPVEPAMMIALIRASAGVRGATLGWLRSTHPQHAEGVTVHPEFGAVRGHRMVGGLFQRSPVLERCAGGLSQEFQYSQSGFLWERQ